ncbi:MAG: glucosamine-6-phosphate isomerase, partial [Lentisphaerae bacterium]|nr:glucosamine-6-phosphate isomerase [Lentisphaerota bacterium]
MRKESVVAPGWWDYTTISKDLVADAAKLTIKDLEQLSRPGFKVVIYDTLEDFYLAEALEYIDAWRQSSPDNPCGICGPIGPTEQLPLVARLVNSLGLNLGKLGAQFWGMDEWVENGVAVTTDHPLSFSKCVKQMCFDLMCPELRMPEENMHFPAGDNLAAYSKTFDQFKCKVMQGGQGDVKHWAFNDPVKREGKYADNPPSP